MKKWTRYRKGAGKVSPASDHAYSHVSLSIDRAGAGSVDEGPQQTTRAPGASALAEGGLGDRSRGDGRVRAGRSPRLGGRRRASRQTGAPRPDPVRPPPLTSPSLDWLDRAGHIREMRILHVSSVCMWNSVAFVRRFLIERGGVGGLICDGCLCREFHG